MKRVVVIGGGFAGSYVARKLENEKFKVILIDSKDYFEFTPGVLRTIVEPEHVKKIQIMHKDYLDCTEIIRGNVKSVTEKYVYVNGRRISFDYLAICSGSSYNVPFKEKDIINTARISHLMGIYKKLCKAKNILVIGGGIVGTELAAELCTHCRDKKITIIHSHDRLIERNPEKASKHAEKFLKERGVKIIYEEIASKAGHGFFITDKGNRFPSDLAFLCTGIVTNFDFLKGEFSKVLNEHKQVIVNDFLQVKGFRNIFSAGDITDRKEEKTAQNAKRQARIVVKNIKALERKSKLKKYISKRTPLVISLGKFNGILSMENLVITGLVPAFLKWAIERREMLAAKAL